MQSLGKLATPEAMAALKAKLNTSPDVAVAYLNGAGKLACTDAARAAACYADLRSATSAASPAVRDAALRGAIVTGGDAGLALWQEAIGATNSDTVDAALRAVLDTPKGAKATQTFAAALAKHPTVKRV